MGRLFWKFFLILWLAQFATAAGVGIAIWSVHSRGRVGEPFSGDVLPHPPELRAFKSEFPPVGKPPQLLPPPLIPILAGSLASLLFAGLLAWYFARPIRILRTAFESVSKGQLETRIGLSMGGRNDELADLGKSFDYMAGRLQSLIDTQKRLLHDVSHELRSPLARMQVAASLMQQQPERSAEFVHRIQRDSVRMDILLGELLTLARLDAGVIDYQEEDVYLREIIGEISDDARLVAGKTQCEIVADVSDSIVIAGNYELLHRAIENVVRNAIRFSPAGTAVTISASKEGGLVRVTVADNGPGVAKDALNSIFEPFVRISPSSSSDGYGLGLSITRKIVEAHRGTIFASNRLPCGLLVTLELPHKKP
jgi:two-component system OmpR family sensor kinase